jgi:hypothetical protein
VGAFQEVRGPAGPEGRFGARRIEPRPRTSERRVVVEETEALYDKEVLVELEMSPGAAVEASGLAEVRGLHDERVALPGTDRMV